MRFDLNLMASVKEQIEEVAQQMKEHEAKQELDENEQESILARIHTFQHQTISDNNLVVAGVDGSGDFPSVNYSDSFIYLTVAKAVIYSSDKYSGLKELSPPDTLVDVAWIPEAKEKRTNAFDEVFERLSGVDLKTVVDQSDYRKLKAEKIKNYTVDALIENLIRPHAFDASNIGIQLRTTAELGVAARLLSSDIIISYLLMDGTFPLPTLPGSGKTSLYYEHLRRYCAVLARNKGTGFFAISKSHGLPGINHIEELARQKQKLVNRNIAEHWFLRLPQTEENTWNLPMLEGRDLPPPESITYIFRLHKNVPVMRLDMDLSYWEEFVRGESEEETSEKEKQIFEHLDQASHDQRSYGYPYPIKAAHDRASLTKNERELFRKQIINAAVKAGLDRKLFYDASIATGHK